jgi:translation initiation factor 2 alpha subunit (eIF-2alpha)
MIELSIREVVVAANSLKLLLELPLPAKEAYRLALASKIIQDRLQTYEKVRETLVRKYGKQVEGDTVIRVGNEDLQKFASEMEPLLNEKVQLDMDPIAVEVLGDVKISSMDMASLSPFFKN